MGNENSTKENLQPEPIADIVAAEPNPTNDTFINNITEQNGQLRAARPIEEPKNHRRSTIKEKKCLPPLISNRKFAGDCTNTS